MMSQSLGTEARVSELLANLCFRRQFLLGPSVFTPTPRWKTLSLDQGLMLSAHPHLNMVAHSTQTASLTLLGFIIDPFNPFRTSEEIIHILAQQTSSFSDLLAGCEPLSGRWVLIFQLQGETFLFTDPCGFRQVFYYTNDQGHWCGSQPEIIRAATGLDREDDEELLKFLMEPSLSRQESAWVGDRTPYRGCRHLMPNHYLKLGESEAVRFFPSTKPETKTLTNIVETGVQILTGSLTAAANRWALMLPVTCGWDSRTMLAASRNVSDRVEYYIDLLGILTENHPDVWVSRRIAKKLGFNFVIKNSKDDLPGWLVSMLTGNVTGARVIPKTRMIYSKFMAQETRVNINGNGSEICRNYFETHHRMDPDNLTIDDLTQSLGQSHQPFVRKEIEKWQAGLLATGVSDYNLSDMLYWEQRLGNWGAQYPAEQDIAIEEFSPFNCRLLLTTLLSAPRELRAAPDFPLYRQMIEAMWAELLAFPFNPAPKINLDPHRILHFLKEQIHPYVPRSICNWLKYKRSG